MNKEKILVAGFVLALSAPAFAQFGGMFQGMIENAAKQAVQQGVEQGVQQGVTQAIAGAPAQAPAAVAATPIVQNGCYYSLPPAPPSAQSFNPDLNGNGCVDQNEYATYLQVIQSAQANAARPVAANPPPAAANGAVAAAVGSAVAARNAGLNGNATAWVAGQNAIGAIGAAAHGQTQPAGNPADASGAGVVTAAPAQAVNNATAEVVSGAVSGALKGLFGR